jgi:hypothetical protein
MYTFICIYFIYVFILLLFIGIKPYGVRHFIHNAAIGLHIGGYVQRIMKDEIQCVKVILRGKNTIIENFEHYICDQLSCICVRDILCLRPKFPDSNEWFPFKILSTIDKYVEPDNNSKEPTLMSITKTSSSRSDAPPSAILIKPPSGSVSSKNSKFNSKHRILKNLNSKIKDSTLENDDNSFVESSITESVSVLATTFLSTNLVDLSVVTFQRHKDGFNELIGMIDVKEFDSDFCVSDRVTAIVEIQKQWSNENPNVDMGTFIKYCKENKHTLLKNI